jgi:type II restriction enzyme
MKVNVGGQDYSSASQRARVLTESWLPRHVLCPVCCSGLVRTPNNTKARDFTCSACSDPFELKSKATRFSDLVADGAYEVMVAAIRANQQPNLFLLRYRLPFSVTDVLVLPRRFLVEPMVIKRKPLAPTARRAGWIGCNLSLRIVPKSALIPCMIDGQMVPPSVVANEWKRTAALDGMSSEARGWAAVTLGVVEGLGRTEFVLSDIYAREEYVANLFPRNRNIRPKLRQQLQVLRDLGVVRFLGRGRYQLSAKHA